ncbi:MAG: hypothetical protein IT495_19945 [Gammaproteobacteria bacterium]|nr:hypothetical protein [Gammaproteobacteria bacterium]
MAPVKTDWTVLRGTLGIFAGCALLSALLVGASQYFLDGARSEYERHHNRFLQVSRKYLTVDEEERIIRSYYPRFVELYNRGIIGREQRLNWLEMLRAASERIQMPGLRYQIDTRAAFAPDFPVDSGAYQIYASTMELDMNLLHEGDFIDLLDMLERGARGLFRISDCGFERAAQHVERDPTHANVRAKCSLQWLTINFPGDREIVL